MAVTNYMTVNGQIRSEHRSGEAKSRDYVHDHLGNVVAVFQNDWAVAMATYDPYGEFLSSWNMSGYKFTWNGGHGYRSTGLEWSSHYVRARHYSFMDGAWTTRDPLWPQEMPYGYVNGMVIKAVDYWGMQTTPSSYPSILQGRPKIVKGQEKPGTPCDSFQLHKPKFRLLGLKRYGDPQNAGSCGTIGITVSVTGSVTLSIGGIPIPGVTAVGGVSGTVGVTVAGTYSCQCTKFSSKVAFRYEEWKCQAPPPDLITLYDPSCGINIHYLQPWPGTWKRHEGRCEGEMVQQVLDCANLRPILLVTQFTGCDNNLKQFDLRGGSTWGGLPGTI